MPPIFIYQKDWISVFKFPLREISSFMRKLPAFTHWSPVLPFNNDTLNYVS